MKGRVVEASFVTDYSMASSALLQVSNLECSRDSSTAAP